MYTFSGINYENDYRTRTFERSFDSLEDAFQWMKKLSNDFSASSNYFPRRHANEEGYDWCGHRGVSIINPNVSSYNTFWINRITTEAGTVYESTDYAHRQFCSKNVERWFLDCTRRMHEEPNFIED